MVTKARKKIHPMPPLSVLDLTIYWSFFILSLFIAFGLFFGGIALNYRIRFSDPTTLATLNHVSNSLSSLAAFGFAASAFLPLIYHYKKRKPIFGRRNFRYGPPAWPREYPLFMRNKPHFFGEKKKRIGLQIFFFSLVLLSLVQFPFSLSARTCLQKDGSIQIYNAVNRLTEEYKAEEISSVRLYCSRAIFTRSGSRKWTVRSVITCADGETFYFNSDTYENAFGGEPQNWLEGMLQIKSCYPHTRYIYENTDKLPGVIQDLELNREEAEILYTLFDIERP